MMTATESAATRGTDMARDPGAGQPRVGPPPPFDPELGAFLSALPPAPPLQPADIPALRVTSAAQMDPGDLGRGGAFEVSRRNVPGPTGDPDVELLICSPTGVTTPTAAVYWIHGGGMIVGNNDSGVAEVLDWAQEFGLTVVSVEYRLAPETPHPGPVEDCYAGLVWTAEHAAELGVDPSRVVVAGASAGGGLAAGVALLARDRNGPALLGQMLIYPMIDDRNDTPSAVQMANSGIWGRTANDTGWSALLGADAQGGPDVSEYAAPARAQDLSGLPPAFLDVGSAENFRDEDVAYASAIWRAGGIAELHVWPGAFHGFDTMVPGAAVSRAAREARVVWLRRLLG
jgi:acetyl esterase/lipase